MNEQPDLTTLTDAELEALETQHYGVVHAVHEEQTRRYQIELAARIKAWRESGIQPDTFAEMDCVEFTRRYHKDNHLAYPRQIVYITGVRYEDGVAGIILYGGIAMTVAIDILTPFERREAQLAESEAADGSV